MYSIRMKIGRKLASIALEKKLLKKLECVVLGWKSGQVLESILSGQKLEKIDDEKSYDVLWKVFDEN